MDPRSAPAPSGPYGQLGPSGQLGPEATYLQALRDGRFLFQRSADGQAVFPPRIVAPGSAAALYWTESTGRGSIHAVTEQPQKPPAPSRFIAIVQMDDGFRLLSQIDTDRPPAIGDRVIARLHPQADPPFVDFIPDPDDA